MRFVFFSECHRNPHIFVISGQLLLSSVFLKFPQVPISTFFIVLFTIIGAFPQVCPHHTETDEQRSARRKEEKKNWEVQLRKNAKHDRTQEDWSRGRSLSPSDDAQGARPRPFGKAWPGKAFRIKRFSLSLQLCSIFSHLSEF